MKIQLRSSFSTQGRRMAGARALWVATRELGSWARHASRIASEIESATLSGWPQVTHSEVNSLFSIDSLSFHDNTTNTQQILTTIKKHTSGLDVCYYRILICRSPPDLAPWINRLPGFIGPFPPPLLIRHVCNSKIFYSIFPNCQPLCDYFFKLFCS